MNRFNFLILSVPVLFFLLIGTACSWPQTKQAEDTAPPTIPVKELTVMKKPKLLKKVPPQYPAICAKAHIRGQVTLKVTTDTSGKVVKTKVINGHPLLRAAVTNAVSQWVYEPYKENGKAKPTAFTVSVNVSPTSAHWCGSYIQYNTEEYKRIYENRFLDVLNNPLSTFSIDVDTASYANFRRFVKNNRLPPKDVLRTEELINYFNYDYPEPQGSVPFSITTELSSCPWNTAHELLHIGIKGKKMDVRGLPPSNLVFLIDVSGSMDSPYKLPLLISSFKLLVDRLEAKDRISIVVYAEAEALVLPPTPGNEKAKISEALDRLRAGGGTAGGAGIKLAYKIVEQSFIKRGNNRVILATDGDFNIGVSSTSELVRMIEEKRKSGIFLTVLGFGTGNYKDRRMEQLADKGNGNYFYIDGILEGKKVFVDEIRATLSTIAKDVKIQLEFNPAKVKAYRLLGYENRELERDDFKDDSKDAGELGSGHTVMALYEIIPASSPKKTAAPDQLKYLETRVKKEAFKSKEMATLKLRYKEPQGKKSKLIVKAVLRTGHGEPSDNFKFSAAVAQFVMLLRESEYKENSTYEGVLSLARSAKGNDPYGYRAEFIKLVETCRLLTGNK